MCGASEPTTGTTLSDFSKKDKPWTQHRRENQGVMGIYSEAGAAGDGMAWGYALRMEQCSNWLEFAELDAESVKAHDNKLKLTRAHFCRVRHCPICAWRKVLALMARFQKNLPEYLMRCPDYAYIYVVLTVRNCEIENLRETIQKMNNGVKKLFKRKAVLPVVKGFVKTIEVTKGQDGNPHPHINLCIAVNKSYFHDDIYLSQAKWTELWQSCMKLDYTPVVYVTKVRDRRKKKDKEIESTTESETSANQSAIIAGMKETVKYSIKPADIVDDPDFLIGITHQLHRMRFMETGGCMKGLFSKPDKRDDSEDPSEITENEMLLKNEDNTDKLSNFRQYYTWGYDDSKRGQYYLRKRYLALPEGQDSGDSGADPGGGGGGDIDPVVAGVIRAKVRERQRGESGDSGGCVVDPVVADAIRAKVRERQNGESGDFGGGERQNE